MVAGDITQIDNLHWAVETEGDERRTFTSLTEAQEFSDAILQRIDERQRAKAVPVSSAKGPRQPDLAVADFLRQQNSRG